jgi:hypothetical protein
MDGAPCQFGLHLVTGTHMKVKQICLTANSSQLQPLGLLPYVGCHCCVYESFASALGNTHVL